MVKHPASGSISRATSDNQSSSSPSIAATRAMVKTALGAATHAANTAKEAAELMFSAGGWASPYTGSGLERCVRDIHVAAQHIILTAANYQMVGQAFLGADMRATPLLSLDDRSGGG